MRLGNRGDIAVGDLIAGIGIGYRRRRGIQFIGWRFQFFTKPRRDRCYFRDRALSDVIGHGLGSRLRSSSKQVDTITASPRWYRDLGSKVRIDRYCIDLLIQYAETVVAARMACRKSISCCCPGLAPVFGDFHLDKAAILCADCAVISERLQCPQQLRSGPGGSPPSSRIVSPPSGQLAGHRPRRSHDYCLGGISITAMLCFTSRVQPESTAITGTPAKGR
jgi:hypothetical protein